MENVIRRVVEHWQKQEIELSPPVSRQELEIVWQRLGRRLSSDVVELYGAAGGFAEWIFEDCCWSFWPISELLIKNQEYKSEGVIFSDFGIVAWGYSFRYEEPTRSSVWYNPLFGEDSERLTSSVEEFLIRYLNDPESVMLSRDQAA
jgi:hypothetical protein